MKRSWTTSVLLPIYIFTLTGLLFFGFSLPVWAATINVPGDEATIQDAIDTAVNGDTIVVAVGTFTETLVLGKSLTIQGAQAGVNACVARAGGESIIDGTGARQLQLIAGSAGSIIDGFTFSGADENVIESTTGPIDNLQILNNILVGFTKSGLFLNDSGDDITIDQNQIEGTSATGTSVHLDTDTFNGFHLTNNCIQNNPGQNALFVDGNRNVGPSATRNPLVSGNLVEGITGSNAVNIGKRALDTATISDNIFRNNTFDVAGGPKNSRIIRNTFESHGTRGLRLTGFGGAGDSTRGAQNNTITANCFLSNGTNGIELSKDQFPGTISSNIVIGNNFIGNTTGAFYDGSETIDAKGNFWGDPTGPSGDGPGTGDPVDGTTGGGSIDFSGFLAALAPGTPCSTAAATPIDHFQCYDVRRSSKRDSHPEVSLNDQFGYRGNVKIGKRVESYCTPVDKAGGGIINPDQTLSCYTVKETRLRQEVVVDNQFGEFTIILKKPELLCVPSTQISSENLDED